MQIKFNNIHLRKLYEGEVVGKPLYSTGVVIKFKQKVKLLEMVESSKTLRNYKSLHFEALKGNKKGLHSIRIDKQYRLEFKLLNDIITNLEIVYIEELSNHYQ